jgi:fructoselysine-6-P-deglycase FrlB-like protein
MEDQIGDLHRKLCCIMGSGKPMRLCFLAIGTSKHTEKWLAYFVAHGYEVHLLSFNPCHFYLT